MTNVVQREVFPGLDRSQTGPTRGPGIGVEHTDVRVRTAVRELEDGVAVPVVFGRLGGGVVPSGGSVVDSDGDRRSVAVPVIPVGGRTPGMGGRTAHHDDSQDQGDDNKGDSRFFEHEKYPHDSEF